MVDSSGNDSTPKPERETGETRSDSDWLAEILAIDPLRDPSAVLSAQRHWLASRLPEESEMAMRIYSAELALSVSLVVCDCVAPPVGALAPVIPSLPLASSESPEQAAVSSASPATAM